MKRPRRQKRTLQEKRAMRQKTRRVWLSATGTLAFLMAMGFSAAPAFAYDGNAAATYADTYWKNYNGNYNSHNQDCANFASQALHAGGYSFVNPGGSQTDDNNWWYSWGWQPFHLGDSNTYSWYRSNDLYLFQMWHYPGGYLYGTAGGQAYAAPPNGLSRGDLVFYNWDSDTTTDLDHVAIQTVVQGRDPDSGWSGDLVDEHTTNRYHAIWTLEPYHASVDAAKTQIKLVHISSSNQ